MSQPSVLGGKTLTIDELTQLIPAYPDGRRPRARAVARRLSSVLELVTRGPNGSKGKGAVYRVVPAKPSPPACPDDEPVRVDEDWLNSAVEKMTRGKRK